MFDKVKLLNKSIQLGSKKNLDELEKIIDKYNIDEYIKKTKNQFKLEIWDKKSPINGVNAKDILSKKKYDIDQVYLIYINNKLVYLQDHNPNESGFVKMTKNDIEIIGNEFIDKKAKELSKIEIEKEIIKEMLK